MQEILVNHPLPQPGPDLAALKMLLRAVIKLLGVFPHIEIPQSLAEVGQAANNRLHLADLIIQDGDVGGLEVVRAQQLDAAREGGGNSGPQVADAKVTIGACAGTDQLHEVAQEGEQVECRIEQVYNLA